MGTNFETLRKLISSSAEISGEARQSLIHLFAQATDSQLEEVVRLFLEDPEWVKRVSENFKSKLEAFENQDAALWEWILKEEVEELDKIQEA